MRPEVWDVLEEVIQDHPVLLNRAPTLHRLGIQAFEPILIEGSAIQIHPLVCSAFNADFDGDQMAVHVPLSAAAKTEAREQMLSVNNLLQPSNGEPIVAPTLDMVLGVYYLTTARPGAKGEGKAFSDFDDAGWPTTCGIIDLQATIKLRVPTPTPLNGEVDEESEPDSQIVTTTMGRAIFNEAINGVLRAHGQEPLPYYNEVVDRAGLKRIVARLIRQYGNNDTAQVLDTIKRLGFRYATQSGTTIAISDITMPNAKENILKGADEEVQRIERDYRRGLITDDERYNEVIEVWTRAKDQVTKAVGERARPVRTGGDDGPVGRQGQHPADLADVGHARPDGRPVRAHHRAADSLVVPRRADRARILPLDARCPQGSGRHRHSYGGLGLPDAASHRRVAERHRLRGGLRHRAGHLDHRPERCCPA